MCIKFAFSRYNTDAVLEVIYCNNVLPNFSMHNTALMVVYLFKDAFDGHGPRGFYSSLLSILRGKNTFGPCT